MSPCIYGMSFVVPLARRRGPHPNYSANVETVVRISMRNRAIELTGIPPLPAQSVPIEPKIQRAFNDNPGLLAAMLCGCQGSASRHLTRRIRAPRWVRFFR